MKKLNVEVKKEAKCEKLYRRTILFIKIRTFLRICNTLCALLLISKLHPSQHVTTFIEPQYILNPNIHMRLYKSTMHCATHLTLFMATKITQIENDNEKKVVISWLLRDTRESGWNRINNDIVERNSKHTNLKCFYFLCTHERFTSLPFYNSIIPQCNE